MANLSEEDQKRCTTNLFTMARRKILNFSLNPSKYKYIFKENILKKKMFLKKYFSQKNNSQPCFSDSNWVSKLYMKTAKFYQSCILTFSLKEACKFQRYMTDQYNRRFWPTLPESIPVNYVRLLLSVVDCAIRVSSHFLHH